MPRIVGVSIRKDEKDYRLDLSWDDGAFLNGDISINAEVSVKDTDGGWSEVKAKASVNLKQVEEGPPDLVVTVGDKEVFSGSIVDIIGEDTVIDKIPREVFALGEPIIGCLLRAGIAASVGQIIDCKDRTAGHEWFLPRTNAMGKCLFESGVKMAGRAAVKAGWCIFAG